MHKSDDVRLRLWLARKSAFTPLIWLAVSLVLGVLAPRLDSTLDLDGGVSPDAARNMLTATGTGMIAFTGFVFSLSLLIVQFGSTSLSPRVVPELRRDRFAGHALGAFVATFVFCLGATLDVGDGAEGATLITVTIAFLLLITSVVMFLGLIQRMTIGLQIPVVLGRLGGLGRGAIDAVYPFPYDGDGLITRTPLPDDADVLYHHGSPMVVATVDVERLRLLAELHDATVELLPAIGERVSTDEALLRVAAPGGGGSPELHHKLRRAIVLAPARTINQDPGYAIRLIVDIAIKALSPAINDPTTATQALDEIEDLLRRLGGRAVTHGDDRVRIRTASWDDLVDLALAEIGEYGARSIQVARRLRALIETVEANVPQARRPRLVAHRDRLVATVAETFPQPSLRALAEVPDPTGLGLSQPGEIDRAARRPTHGH